MGCVAVEEVTKCEKTAIRFALMAVIEEYAETGRAKTRRCLAAKQFAAEES